MPDLTSGTSAPVLNRSEVSRASPTLYLVGNPNVGKSVIFGALTGRYVTVSNYPGTTIEVARGTAVLDGRPYTILDSPGTNQLTPVSEDERVTRQLLLERQDGSVVQVADSKNLRRALMLTLELGELGLPLTLALNMADEARSRGIRVDRKALESLLGIPVIPTVATRREGLGELGKAVAQSRPLSEKVELTYPVKVEQRIEEIVRLMTEETVQPAADLLGRESELRVTRLPGDEQCTARFLALQLLSGDDTLWPYLQNRLSPDQVIKIRAAVREAVAPGDRDLRETIRRTRLALVDRILYRVFTVSRKAVKPDVGQRLSTWALHPIKGLGMLAVLLYLTYWFVGLIGAGTLVDYMETGLFGQVLNPMATRVVDHLAPFPHEHEMQVLTVRPELPLVPTVSLPLGPEWSRSVPSAAYTIPPGVTLSRGQEAVRLIHDFLVGRYGAVTMGLSYGFAIVLPIVTTFFLLFSLLEDSGYLPRLAVMLNRFFRTMGLNGKAVLPMVLGLGCDTMATLTTRILETRKQRLIVTLLLALGVPCSAQLGVLLGMLSHVSLLGAILWAGIVTLVMFTVGYLAARLFPGEQSDFLIELPPMRRPVISNIVLKTLARMQWYLREVLPLFLLGTALLFVLDRTHALEVLRNLASPVVVHWLGLPHDLADAFILGFLRRDYGAVFLLEAASGPHPVLNGTQVVVSMTVITLFVPCIANLFIIVREHGWKIATGMAVFIFPFAFLIGGLVRLLAVGLHIPF